VLSWEKPSRRKPQGMAESPTSFKKYSTVLEAKC
jgi:hypothetical protein